MMDVEEGNCNGSPNKENVCDVPQEKLCQIMRQCEFYFCDANILKDQFMLNQVRNSKDGWVKLSVIENFKMMKQLVSCHEVMIKALSSSDKLEVSIDGLCVRRIAALPVWDRHVYFRTIIISDLPDDSEFSISAFTDALSSETFQPMLVRLFTPDRKIPSDLKWSQASHPHLGTKRCAVIEFKSRKLCTKAIELARLKWPEAYIRLLSLSPKQAPGTSRSQKKKLSDKMEDLDPKSVSHSTDRRAFLAGLKSYADILKPVHVREPTKPPTEASIGFKTGWRNLLTMEHLVLSEQCHNVSNATTKVPETAVMSTDSVQPLATDFAAFWGIPSSATMPVTPETS